VPARNLVGELGAGYRQTLKVLEAGESESRASRRNCARRIRGSGAYALKRGQFGKKIAEFQASSGCSQWRRASTRRGCSFAAPSALKDAGKPFAREAAMAKVVRVETADVVHDQSVQIHGATATSRTSRSSATCATPSSRKSAEAPVKSSADHREVAAARRLPACLISLPEDRSE